MKGRNEIRYCQSEMQAILQAHVDAAFVKSPGKVTSVKKDTHAAHGDHFVVTVEEVEEPAPEQA